ncbi:MAG: SDR family NAD(P)-dependent oxidoreductase [Sneathiella sp.]
MVKNIAIIGSSGAIGCAFVNQAAMRYEGATIHACSRQMPKRPVENVQYYQIDYSDEKCLEDTVSIVTQSAPLDMVIVATGLLHKKALTPEKSLKDLSAEKFHALFEANTIVPALAAKHFLPRLNRDTASFFAALSARVGSVSDNRLGGWYAYRSSKSALNMVIKNAAIEIGRRNKQATIVGLHPGTVDSSLSAPFQGNVPDGKLFTAEFSVQKMLDVLENLTPEQSGLCFAWDGSEVEP